MRRTRWAWSIGSLAGIDVRIHATFLALLGWILLSHVVAGHGLRVALVGLAAVMVVFAVIVLHELGHALVARRFGIRTRDITLLPIGGIARLERMPTDPGQELLVALAGPAVNVALAALAALAVVALGLPWSPRVFAVGAAPLAQFLWLNIGLAVFNLIPAFPTDGGRVLRALLATRMDRVRATDVAARIGQLLAMGIGLLGFFGNPMLVFIALFIWIGAAEEDAVVHMSASLDGLRVADAMLTEFESIPPSASIDDVLAHAIHGTQRVFPVLDRGRLLGVASMSDLARAVARRQGAAPITSVATTNQPAASSEPVQEALERMNATGARALAVVDDGVLVGLLLPQTIMEIAQMRDALLADVT